MASRLRPGSSLNSQGCPATAPHSGQNGAVVIGPLPEGWTLDRVTEVGQLRLGARLLDPVGCHVFYVAESRRQPLSVATIIDTGGGLCLCLDADDGEWWMGQLDETNEVECWATHGEDLEQALLAL